MTNRATPDFDQSTVDPDVILAGSTPEERAASASIAKTNSDTVPKGVIGKLAGDRDAGVTQALASNGASPKF